MLEESIDSSPNSFNSSIRIKREHRKTKRTRLNDLLLHRSHASNDDNQLIQLYYDNSDPEDLPPLPATHGGNSCKRFQAENIMAKADRCAVAQKERRNLPEITQQFSTCERLIETQGLESIGDLNTSVPSNQNTIENTLIHFESEWILKAFEEDDDMLLQADDDANQNQNQNQSERTLVPEPCDKTIVEDPAEDPQWENNLELGFMDWSSPIEHAAERKTIVETILEDFCTSSSSVSSEMECGDLNLEDFMPFFRFRRKKIRTYERCWRRPTSGCERANYQPDDGGELSDGSSELSVQEDASQVLPAAEPLEHLNTSSRIRNNLLDLSAFFTQNLVGEDEVEDDDFDEIAADLRGYEAIRQLIMEIPTLHAKYQVSSDLSRWSSAEDFRGFVIEGESIEDDTDRAVNELQRRDVICRSAPDLMRNYGGANEHSTPDSAENSKSEPPITIDEESWHCDDDFFVNFQTQRLINRENMNDTNRNRRNSDSTVKLSTPKAKKKPPEEAKDDRNRRESEEPGTSSRVMTSPTHRSTNEITDDAFQSQIPVEEILKQYESQKNALRKFETSRVFENEFDCMILSEWPLDEPEFGKKDTFGGHENNLQRVQSEREALQQSTWNSKDIWGPQSTKASLKPIGEFGSIEDVGTSSRKASSTENEKVEEFGNCFIGFQTASRKAIKISEEAQKRAESVFAELPDLPEEINEQSSSDGKIPPPNPRIEETKNEEYTGNCFIGFQTASRKTINISEEARKRAESILAELPDLPEEINEQSSSDAAFQGRTGNVPPPNPRIEETKNEENTGNCFTGFQTASRKTIKISEEAQKRAESIFAELPDLPEDLPEESDAFQGRTGKVAPPNPREANAQECFTGFQTASRKAINVSKEAQKRIESVFAQLPDLPGEEGAKKEADDFKDFSSIPLSEWIPSCDKNRESEITSEPGGSKKRRLQTDNDDGHPAKIICKSHTIAKSPIHTPTGSNDQHGGVKATRSHGILNGKIIGRRNLLSLTKRRRESTTRGAENNLKREVSEENVETPVKLLSSAWAPKSVLTPHTPQAGEFFVQQPNAASTPQSMGGALKVPDSKKPNDNLESDFQRINWENNEDLSATPTRLNSSDLSKSLKAQPSPRERIENLSSCGDPPPLPQLVDSNSRSRRLGMSRRQRSCIARS